MEDIEKTEEVSDTEKVKETTENTTDEVGNQE